MFSLPKQPHHTLKEAIQAQVISLQLDLHFSKFSISIQDKIVMRIFEKHAKNDQAITIDALQIMQTWFLVGYLPW